MPIKWVKRSKPTITIILILISCNDGVCHTPPAAFFQAGLLDNQEGANAERYVCLQKALGEVFPTPSFFAPALRTAVPTTVETPSMENPPRWGVIYIVPGTRYCCTHMYHYRQKCNERFCINIEYKISLYLGTDGHTRYMLLLSYLYEDFLNSSYLSALNSYPQTGLYRFALVCTKTLCALSRPRASVYTLIAVYCCSTGQT